MPTVFHMCVKIQYMLVLFLYGFILKILIPLLITIRHIIRLWTVVPRSRNSDDLPIYYYNALMYTPPIFYTTSEYRI